MLWIFIDPSLWIVNHEVDPAIKDRGGERFSTLPPDLTLSVSCITDEHNLDTALIDGLPNHPLILSTFNIIGLRHTCVPALMFALGIPVGSSNILLAPIRLLRVDAPTSL